MRSGKSLIAVVILAGIGALVPTTAARAADKARLSGLADVAFGPVNVSADQTSSQNVCAFSSSSTGGYSVSAIGTGTNGAFTLTTGAAQLPYEVFWADTINQAGGTALAAGGTTTGFTSNAGQQTCNSGPSASASLTVVLRAAALNSATAGNYTGTLQITIAPE